MFVIDKQKNEVFSLPAKEIRPEDAASVSSELASKILHLIAREPMYTIDIAKSLKMHEQKIYYHIRNESEFLEPFISNGQLDSLIIVGSPDPHGPDKARSRDGYYK